jgi:hypothetical protein
VEFRRLILIAGFGAGLAIAPLAAAADDQLTEAISLTREAIKHLSNGRANRQPLRYACGMLPSAGMFDKLNGTKSHG